MAVPFAAAAGNRAVGVDFAVEDEDVAVRLARSEEKAERQRVDGMVFVAFAPCFRPVAQGALLVYIP